MNDNWASIYPWVHEHPGWGNLTSHRSSKWVTRFVISGLDGEIQQVISHLKQSLDVDYSYIIFSEETLFPGENSTYAPACVYFFPTSERSLEYPVTKEEIFDLYWY